MPSASRSPGDGRRSRPRRRPRRWRAGALLAAAVVAAGASCSSYRYAGASPPRPPDDPAERRRAELDACSRGTFPLWLDDAALGEASRADPPSTANDSFRPSTAAAEPAHAVESSGAAPRSRVGALLEARRDFQRECEVVRGGKALGLP